MVMARCLEALRRVVRLLVAVVLIVAVAVGRVDAVAATGLAFAVHELTTDGAGQPARCRRPRSGQGA
jgi:hypothetical protein